MPISFKSVLGNASKGMSLDAAIDKALADKKAAEKKPSPDMLAEKKDGGK